MSSANSLSLTDKVAIITGSGKENGIGAGIALTLARAGASVVINYVSETTTSRATEVVTKIEAEVGKGRIIVVQADVSTPEGTKKLVQETLKGFDVKHIDILVNNAAKGGPGPSLMATSESVNETFAVNVFGPLYLIQAAEPFMSRGGRIINIGSVATKLGIEGMGLYCASKAAIEALTFVMARELGRSGKGITINTVSPGPVTTLSLIHI